MLVCVHQTVSCRDRVCFPRQFRPLSDVACVCKRVRVFLPAQTAALCLPVCWSVVEST